MNPFPMGTGVKVWLWTGYTDMRCGFPSLALRVQEVLKHDPLTGHLFVFRGRRSDILKIIDGLEACLFTRRLEKGRFIWSRRGSDITGTIVIFVVRDRLAQSAGNLASDIGRIGLLH